MSILPQFKRVILALVFTTLSTFAFAQNVQVTGALVGNGIYPDLGSAFTAINGGAQTGATISVSIIGSTVETVSAVLNQNSWTNLSIFPSGGGARTISGSIAGPLVDFNSADKVDILGINSGGNSLTFDNQNTGNASTIRFINDARRFTVTGCTIQGANTATTSGTVFLSTGSGSGGGNDSINFTACLITGSGANFPTNGVYSAGTPIAGQENSIVAFGNCNIADFFNPSTISCGILAAAGNSDWIIFGNFFYQTASRTYTTANTHRGIQIQSGNNHFISTNTIGYTNSFGSGTYTMASTVATRFIGIDLSVGTTVASSVQGNTVTAIALNTSSGASTTNGIICGINITGGNVNVGNLTPNTIGGNAGANLIVGTSTTAGGVVVGMNCSSTGTILIQNNIIGGLSSSGTTASVSGGISGINVSGVTTSMTITGNTIGNATANNMRGGTVGLTTGSSICGGINLASLPSAFLVSNNIIQNITSYGTGVNGFARGIWTLASSAITTGGTISGNTISNLTTNAANVSISNGQASAVGINISAGTNVIANGNIISAISNFNTGAIGSYVVGITLGNATNTTVSNNLISGITNASTSVSATAPGTVAGVIIRSGTTAVNIFNNMINLTSTDNNFMIGIEANHGSTPDPIDNIFHNTINISGTVTAGAQPSFCFCRTDYSTTARAQVVNFKNNLCTNSRTGGTGLHYAIGNNYGATVPAATGWGTNASNNNVLNANATSIGWWGSAMTFAAWQTASASDANSYSGIAVTYVNPASNLHLNMGVAVTPIESGGQTIASVTTDIDGQARPGPVGSVNGGAFLPDIGADEFDGVPTCFQPIVATASATASGFCAGGSSTLNVTGTLNGATNWQWYSGTCGGTPAGTGTGIVVTPTVTTTYYVRGEGGCSTPLSCTPVTIIVNPLPAVTATPTSAAVCAGQAITLTGGGATTYAWSGPEIISNNVAFTPSFAGTYTVTGTDGNGCTNTATSVISINALPVVTATPSASTVCSGSSLTLTGGGTATSYTWSGPQTISDNTPFLATTSGTYTVTGTDGNGCVDTDLATVTVNALPIVTATPSSSTVCDGTSLTLNGGGATTYSWSGPQTISNNTPFLATTSGTYTVSGTDGNGCVNTATSSVTVNALPIVTATPSSSTVCSGASLTLNGGGATSYTWSGPQTITDNVSFTASTSGNFIVSGTDGNGCVNTATATVTVNALPVVTATPTSTLVCVGSSLILSGGGATTYSWNGPEVIADNVSFNPTLSGTYTVSGTDGNGCVNTATSSVTVNALPIVTATPASSTVCDGTSLTLNGGGASSYSWSGPQVIADNVAFIATTGGTYTVTGTDANGCVNTATSSVTVNTLPTVVYSETITTACVNWNPITLAAATPAGGTYSGIAVTGNAFDPATAGAGTYYIVYTYTDGNGCVNADSSAILVDLCLSTTSVVASSELNMYPNPTSGMVTIDLSGYNNETVTIEIRNSLGQLLLSKTSTQSTVGMDVSEYANGVYFVSVNSNAKRMVKELILQK